MNFRNKLAEFMYGRYGTDSFYNFLIIVELILIFINLFVSSIVISLLIFAIVFYALWRTFSRNIAARQKENAVYLRILNKVKGFFSKGTGFGSKKTHVFRICPACKANIRLPRKKGAHKVRCPRCQTLFDVFIR